MNSETRSLLEGVRDGIVSVDDALLQLKKAALYSSFILMFGLDALAHSVLLSPPWF